MPKEEQPANWRNNIYARDYVRQALKDWEAMAARGLQTAIVDSARESSARAEGQVAWWQAVRRVIKWQLSQVNAPRIGA